MRQLGGGGCAGRPAAATSAPKSQVREIAGGRLLALSALDCHRRVALRNDAVQPGDARVQIRLLFGPIGFTFGDRGRHRGQVEAMNRLVIAAPSRSSRCGSCASARSSGRRPFGCPWPAPTAVARTPRSSASSDSACCRSCRRLCFSSSDSSSISRCGRCELRLPIARGWRATGPAGMRVEQGGSPRRPRRSLRSWRSRPAVARAESAVRSPNRFVRARLRGRLSRPAKRPPDQTPSARRQGIAKLDRLMECRHLPDAAWLPPVTTGAVSPGSPVNRHVGGGIPGCNA